MNKAKIIFIAAFGLALILIVGYWIFKPKAQADWLQESRGKFKVKWEKQHSLEFSDAAEIASMHSVEGKWEITDGMLRAVEGEKNRALLVAPCGFESVRVEFDVTLFAAKDGKIGDITVLLNAENGDSPKNWFENGYALTTGSYWNNCSTFYKKGEMIARTEYSPLVSGQKYKVAVEFHKGHIRYWLDDKIILEAWDAQPLEMDEKLWIGIRTWDTLMAVDNLTVFSGKD